MKNGTDPISVLLAALPPLRQVMRGSLLQRKTFHSEGCAKCAAGTGHPQWVINMNYPGGRTRQVSVRPEQVAQVEQWMSNYRQIKEALEAASEMNLELVRSSRGSVLAPAGPPASDRPARRKSA